MTQEVAPKVSSESARASQKLRSISRYIVVAIVRCSWAGSHWPSRRRDWSLMAA